MNKLKNLQKIFFICFLATVLSGCFGTTPIGATTTQNNTNGIGEDYIPPDSSWLLMWSDEFNGSVIDSRIWTHETGFGSRGDGWGNNEKQNYTTSSDNSYIENGKLIIKAIYTGGDHNQRGNYTSARLKTQDKFSFRYGLLVARMKSPEGQGLWPAIWMLGDSISDPNVGWPRCGEIDLFEMFGHTETTFRQASGTAHWSGDKTICNAGSTETHRYCGGEHTHSQKLSEDFNNYSLEWNETRLVWRFNGVVYYTLNIGDAEFDEFRAGNFFILANVAVGGNPFGAFPPISSTPFPQTMEIDWIRVYTNSGE